MEGLPLEIYDYIFDHLHLIDLAKLRRVCKKFRFLVQEYRIKELLLGDSKLKDPGEYQNSCIIQPKNMKNFVFYSEYKYGDIPYTEKTIFTAKIFLKSGLFNVQFLKSLSCVYTCEDGAVRLADINKLVKLERLEIRFGCDVPSSGDKRLSLPNLRTLLLLWCVNDYTIEIDAPKCEGFHFENHNNIPPNGTNSRPEFKYPDSVKYLSLYRYHKELPTFKNVEFLQISSTAITDLYGNKSSPGLIDEKLFAAFPRLKTLKIMNYGSLVGLKELFRAKNLLRGRRLEMYFHGIRLDDGKELDVFEENDLKEKSFFAPQEPWYPHFSTPAHFSAQMHNYDKLDNGLNFVKQIDLNETLSETISEKVWKFFEADSRRFLRIFDNVSLISTNIKIKRPELFLRFLTSFRLISLKILHSNIPREYFNQLESIKTLEALNVEEEKKIDFSFANKLPKLQTLRTNYPVALGKEFKLCERKRVEIKVKIGEFLISIDKNPYYPKADGTERDYTVFKQKTTNRRFQLDWYVSQLPDNRLCYTDAVRRFEEELQSAEESLSGKLEGC